MIFKSSVSSGECWRFSMMDWPVVTCDVYLRLGGFIAVEVVMVGMFVHT